MLCNSLNAIYEEIKTYLFSTDSSFDLNKLVIALPQKNQNPSGTICLSLVNIEEEKVLRSQSNYSKRPDDRISHHNPELRLNIFILVAADFSVHKDALKHLSSVIKFFQGKNVFRGDNTPSLDPSIEKMIIDLHTLNLETQNHLWGVLGARYVPSVVYRVQTLIIQENLRKDDQEPILKINISTKRN